MGLIDGFFRSLLDRLWIKKKEFFYIILTIKLLDSDYSLFYSLLMLPIQSSFRKKVICSERIRVPKRK